MYLYWNYQRKRLSCWLFVLTVFIFEMLVLRSQFAAVFEPKEIKDCVHFELGQCTDVLRCLRRAKPRCQDVLEAGGRYEPEICQRTPLARSAILIPYRDREENLETLLPHLHCFLQAQDIAYKIYVIEQVLDP